MANDVSINMWKQRFQPTPNKPAVVTISFFDAFFYEDEKTHEIKPRFDTTGQGKHHGLRLPHDIICFPAKIYNTTGNLIVTKENIGKWCDFGFDVATPTYDFHAVRKFFPRQTMVPCQNMKNWQVFDERKTAENGNHLISRSKKGTYIFDKDAVLQYPTNREFFKHSIIQQDKNTIYDLYDTTNSLDGENNGYFAFLNKKVKALSVTVENVKNVDIILQEEDEVMLLHMLSQGSNKPYLTLTFGHTSNMYELFYKTFEFDVKANYQTFFKELVDAVPADEELQYILKHNYFLLRASFFADYVNPIDFNQSLNQDASVTHSNLMTKRLTADFNRYDNSIEFKRERKADEHMTEVDTRIKNDEVERTRAYIPQTTPTVDLASKEFYKKITKDVPTTSDNYYETDNRYQLDNVTENPRIGLAQEFYQKLVDVGDDPDSELGALRTDPIDRHSAEYFNLRENSSLTEEDVKEINCLNPPGYFDTEARRHASYYPEHYERIPMLVPKEGNIFTDGRIFGVTIDEIWTAIKKCMMGRRSDNDPTVNEKLEDQIVPYGSADTNNNPDDSRIWESTDNNIKFTYNDKDTKWGDPISMMISPYEDKEGNQREKLLIDLFVDNNDSIRYRIYEAIQQLDSEVTHFDPDINEENGTNARSIENFRPWTENHNRHPVRSFYADMVPQRTPITQTETRDDCKVANEWAPRKVAWSLRELEAGYLGNKYNLLALARYLKENFAITGHLGKVFAQRQPLQRVEYTEAEDKKRVDRVNKDQFSAGSLYQLHKDYNYIVDDPNTYFDINRENETVNKTIGEIDKDRYSQREWDKQAGRGAMFDDGNYDYSNEDPRGALFQSMNHRYNHDMYGDGLKYGAVNGYDVSECYLAADGTWRFIYEHPRVPILHTKY